MCAGDGAFFFSITAIQPTGTHHHHRHHPPLLPRLPRAASSALTAHHLHVAAPQVREMGWASSVLLPVEGPATASPPPAPRFKGPEEAALESLGLAHAPATSLEPRQAEIAVLATAYAYRSAAAWTVHVREYAPNPKDLEAYLP